MATRPRDVGKTFGVNRLTVYAWMRKYGIRKPARGDFTDDIIAKIQAAKEYEEACRPPRAEEVATELGVSSATVYGLMRRHGIKKKRGKHGFTPEVTKKVRAALETERKARPLTAKQAAKRFGISVNALYREMSKCGVSPPGGFRPKFLDDLEWRIRKRRAQRGMSGAEVARKLGVSTTVLFRAVRKHGIEREPGRRKFTPELVKELRKTLKPPKRRPRQKPAKEIPNRPMSSAEAGRVLGISATAVYERILRHGLKARLPLSPRFVRELRDLGPSPRPAGGMTLAEACEELGMNSPQIYELMDRHGIKKKPGPYRFTPEIVGRLKRAREKEARSRGMMAREAAAVLGLKDSGHLYRRLEKYGIPRPRGRAAFTPEIVKQVRRGMERDEKARAKLGLGVIEASRELGVSPPILYQLLRKHGIRKEPGVRKFDERVMRQLRVAAKQRRELKRKRRRAS